MRRRRTLASGALLIATVAGLAVVGAGDAALTAMPVLLAFALLGAGHYPGAEQLVRCAARSVAHRRRRIARPIAHSDHRPAGCLLGAPRRRRGPPASAKGRRRPALLSPSPVWAAH